MCSKDSVKLFKELRKPLNSIKLRQVLQEATDCDSCRYQVDTNDPFKEAECLFYHQAEFKNRLAYLSQEMKI